MFTHFHDMHSGGGTKESPYEHIYIESHSEDEAKIVFYNRFGHNPKRVSCTCCGEDYSISSDESLAQLTGYERGCMYDKATNKYIEEYQSNRFQARPTKLLTLEEYFAQPTKLLILSVDIKSEERTGDVPTQGYVYL